jgi:ABC-type multidrug transport system ATPase subunit
VSATISCKDLTASFGARDLFVGLDLEVAPGDVLGLVGPNGTGKTTLLRILAGLREPDGGTVTVAPSSATEGGTRAPGDFVGALWPEELNVYTDQEWQRNRKLLVIDEWVRQTMELIQPAGVTQDGPSH